MDLDLGTQARRAAQTAGGSQGLPAPLLSGAPTESPAAAPAQRTPGSAQGWPPSPPASHQAQEGPGPWGPLKPAAWGLLFPPRRSCPTSEARGPRSGGQRGALSKAQEPCEQRDGGGEAPGVPSPWATRAQLNLQAELSQTQSPALRPVSHPPVPGHQPSPSMPTAHLCGPEPPTARLARTAPVTAVSRDTDSVHPGPVWPADLAGARP